MRKSSNPTFPSCDDIGVCKPDFPLSLYPSGFCVPSSNAVTACEAALGNGCECSISDSDSAFAGVASIMDIYISNKSDETLFLISGSGDDQILAIGKNGNKEDDAGVGWMSKGANDYKPPKKISPNTTVFVRGYLICGKECGEEDTTFKIVLQYSIGVPGKKLGNLVIPVCRFRSKGKKPAPFGSITPCSGTSVAINPPSGIYGVTVERFRETQALIVITGSKNGEQCKVSPDNCPTGMQCNPNTLKCEKKTTNGNGGDLSNRQLLLLVVVSGIAILFTFGFLTFLVVIKRRKQKTS